MGSPAQHAPSGTSDRPGTGPAPGRAQHRRRQDTGRGELLLSGRRGIKLRAVASLSSSFALAMSERTAGLLFDRLAVAVLVAVAGVALMTFRDYGLGWDDYTHSEYGELLVALYGSGFADRRALSFVNLYKYGGGFDMLGAPAGQVTPFT